MLSNTWTGVNDHIKCKVLVWHQKSLVTVPVFNSSIELLNKQTKNKQEQKQTNKQKYPKQQLSQFLYHLENLSCFQANILQDVQDPTLLSESITKSQSLSLPPPLLHSLSFSLCLCEVSGKCCKQLSYFIRPWEILFKLLLSCKETAGSCSV